MFLLYEWFKRKSNQAHEYHVPEKCKTIRDRKSYINTNIFIYKIDFANDNSCATKHKPSIQFSKGILAAWMLQKKVVIDENNDN